MFSTTAFSVVIVLATSCSAGSLFESRVIIGVGQ
jgi:hypothetical protein